MERGQAITVSMTTPAVVMLAAMTLAAGLFAPRLRLACGSGRSGLRKLGPYCIASRDTLQTIHLDNYYDTYNLLAGYLALLDDTLGKESN